MRELWPEATVSTLPHLAGQKLFPTADTAPLLAEANPRALRTLQDALRRLAVESDTRIRNLRSDRALEHRLLREAVDRDIRGACRFSKAFFSDEFRKRLDVFSPWQLSLRRIRSLVKAERSPSLVVDLFADAPVQRHAIGAAKKVRQRILRHLEALAQRTGAEAVPVLPEVPEDMIRSAVSDLVRATNAKARRDVETLMESLQENRRVKDPVWGLVAGVSSSLLLLELVIPGFGTLSSMAFSGVLSALGFGGIFTADMMRKLRSTQVKESFENGLRDVLENSVARLLDTDGPFRMEDLSELSGRLSAWTSRLPEVVR